MASSPSSPPISAIPAADLRRLFTIIARPQNRQQQQFDAEDVLKEISKLLGTYGISCRITYIKPNYIIDPANPHLQSKILSWSPLRTAHMILDLVPWSREHEHAQLPWIIDNIQDDSAIIIDPLTILSTTSTNNKKTGNSKLKHDFVAMMDMNYDLRAPDFSYLMINEIKDYYVSKHNTITMCKQIAITMGSSLQEFLQNLNLAAQRAQRNIQPLQPVNHTNTTMDSHSFADHLRTATTEATTQLTNINELLESVRCLSDAPINLDSYKNIPPLTEIPVPPSYATRLRTIHTIATKHVYGAEAIVTTAETPQGEFETYIKIGDYIHKYREIPMKTAGTIQTIAIYHSLRYITNVLGFRIIDLNYPTLAMLMSAIHKTNSDFILLQSCVNAIITHSQSIYEAFIQLQQELAAISCSFSNQAELHTCMEELISNIQEHHTAATDSFHQFMDSKEQYLITYLQTESPTITPSRWIQLQQAAEIQDPLLAPPARRRPSN